MRHFFKFIAVFLPFSLALPATEEIEIVKVEVATVIWKDQNTSEKFEIVDENILFYQLTKLVLHRDTLWHLIFLTQKQIKQYTNIPSIEFFESNLRRMMYPKFNENHNILDFLDIGTKKKLNSIKNNHQNITFW